MKIFANKKRMIAIILIIMFCDMLLAKGWVKEGDDWKYKDKDDKYVTDKMISSADTKAYLDENGIAVSDYLYKDKDGNIYYFNEKHAMCVDTSIEIDKNTKSNFKIEFDATYHFGSNGIADYYINKTNNETVVLVDTWLKDTNNKWYFKTKDGDIKKDVLLKTGQNIYYVDKTGYRVENYILKDYKNSTYYFNNDGEMVKDAYVLVNHSTNSNKKIDSIYLLQFDYSGKLIDETKCSKNSKINRIVSFDARIDKDGEDIIFKDEEAYSINSVKEKIKNVKVDDKIKFGKYEQDGNLRNGDELISWIVLDVNDENVTLISEYILDCLSYSSMYTNSYGENIKKYVPSYFNTDIRGFLNGEFLNESFTKDEIRMIKSIESSRIHLLTKEQYIKYFGVEEIDGTNKNAIAKGTKYAILQGLDVSKKETWYNGCGSYWLETRSETGDKVMWSGVYGHLYQNGQDPILKNGDGVRPLIVIDK